MQETKIKPLTCIADTTYDYLGFSNLMRNENKEAHRISLP